MSKLELLHDILQRDEITDVEGGLVLKGLNCGVEIDKVDLATEGLSVGDESGAKGRLSRSRRTSDEHGVTHGGNG